MPSRSARASHDTVSGDGSIAWTYSISDGALDFLGANDVVTLTYTVQADDHNGGTTSQNVTITVSGTEDAPTLTSGTQAATITENADDATGENTATHTVSGAVTFNDVDLSDLEASSITNTAVSPTLANGYTLTTAQHDALVNAFSIGRASHDTVSGDGSIAWTYSISDGALDFLGANDVVTLTYTVQADDHNGGTTSQNVTITVSGTEDAPTLTSGTQAATVTEDRRPATGENTDDPHRVGGGDVQRRRPVRPRGELDHQHRGQPDAGQRLRPDHGAARRAGQRVLDRPASHDTVSGDGSIAWTYSISDGALDFLGANDVVTLTYTVQADDHNGGTTSQNVTITVSGTEDAPTLTSGTQAATVTEDADGATGENTETHTVSGAVTFNDVDLSDLEASSITNTAVSPTLANGYALTTAQHDALVNAFSIDPAPATTRSAATARSPGPIRSPTARSTSSAPTTW